MGNKNVHCLQIIVAVVCFDSNIRKVRQRIWDQVNETGGNSPRGRLSRYPLKILQKTCGINTARVLKYVWAFFNIMHKKGY